MKRFNKRILSFILTVIMLACAIPVNISAEGEAGRVVLVAWEAPVGSPPGTTSLWPSDTGPDAMNTYAELGSSLWSPLSWSSNSYLAEVSGSSTIKSNWANGGDYIMYYDSSKKMSYWTLYTISTIGYKELSLSFSVRSSATGPRNFKVQYTTTCGELWDDVPGASYSVTSTSVTPVGPFTIPADANNAPELNIRMIMTDNHQSGGGGSNVSPSGTSNIANITLTGEPITPTPEPTYAWQKVSSASELEEGGEYVIYGAGGNTVYSGALGSNVSNGSAEALDMSGYFSGADIVDPPVTAIWMLVSHPSVPGRWALYNQYTRRYMEITGDSTTSFALTNSPGYYYTAANSLKWPGAINFISTCPGNRSIMIFNEAQFRCYAPDGAYGGPTYLYKKTLVGNPVLAPTASVIPGLVAPGVGVALSQADGAAVYYTTDGSIPTDGSELYAQPIAVPPEGMTIKAVAINGEGSSAVVTFAYRTILPIADALQRVGEMVTVEGYASYYATSAQGLTNGVYIQDGSGAGINIFRPSIYATPGCMNKLIRVTGVVNDYNGLIELVIPDDSAIRMVNPHPAPIAPITTTIQDIQVKANPFVLISLSNVKLVSVGGTDPNTDYNHTIQQNGRSITLRAPGLSYPAGSYVTITKAVATVNNNSIQVYVNRDSADDIVPGEETWGHLPETAIATWHITSGTPLTSNIYATGGVQAASAAFKMLKDNTPIVATWGGGGMRLTGLDNGANNTWWVAELSSSGYTDITASIDMRSSPTGPSEFRVEYSVDGVSWYPAGSHATIKINIDAGSGEFDTFTATLPIGASDCETLYIRWLLTSNTAVNNNPIASGGVHNINNIAIFGNIITNVIGDSIELSVIENQVYTIALTAQSITDFSGKTMTIAFNDLSLQLINSAAQVYGTHMAVGVISGTNIKITDISQGSISLAFNEAVPPDAAWSGPITILEFRALTTGSTVITLST